MGQEQFVKNNGQTTNIKPNLLKKTGKAISSFFNWILENKLRASQYLVDKVSVPTRLEMLAFNRVPLAEEYVHPNRGYGRQINETTETIRLLREKVLGKQ